MGRRRIRINRIKKIIDIYMHERLIRGKHDTAASVKHIGIMRAACIQMKNKIDENSGMSVDWLFGHMINDLDDWACSTKSQNKSYIFSTSRDVLIDLYDFIMMCNDSHRKHFV